MNVGKVPHKHDNSYKPLHDTNSHPFMQPLKTVTSLSTQTYTGLHLR